MPEELKLIQTLVENVRDDLKQFQKDNKEDHNYLFEKIDKIRDDVNNLKLWKSKIVGIAGFIAFIVSVGGTYLIEKLRGK